MATESEYKQRDALDYVRVTFAADSSVQARRFPTGNIDPQKIADPPLQNRRFVFLRNDGEDGTGSRVIYIGGADLTEENGYPLLDNMSGAPYKSQRVLLDLSDTLAVYGIKKLTVENFRTLELA
jgi:hypothetical protein